MNSEALDAIAGHTMRPSALDAATTRTPADIRESVDNTSSKEEHSKNHDRCLDTPMLDGYPTTPSQPSTPFGQRTDGTQSAAKAIEGVVHGVKVAVDGAIAWAGKKVDDLSLEADSTGPYTSQATCAPSDLDPIAGGILAAMSTQGTDGTNESTQQQISKDKKEQQEENRGQGALGRKTRADGPSNEVI